MNKEFDLLVFIGRFQPFHLEHKRIIDIALTKAENVLVLVGSAGSARTVRNPFDFYERQNMIEFCYPNQNVIVKPLYDKTYQNSSWIKQVQELVNETTLDIINGGGFHNHGLKDARIGLVGANKDSTSYYLKMFPQWESVGVSVENDIHATDIRNTYFSDEPFDWKYAESVLPKNVSNYLLNYFYYEDVYKILCTEYNHIKSYKEGWAVAPYPVKHVTVDTLVEQSGHVLLVRRKSAPGKGLWAIPGGHLNEYEDLEDGALRELFEETKIKVPESVLRGSIVNQRTFADPHRSTIGRVITYAYHIRLRGETKLPKVKGSDDAEKAVWVPIAKLKENDFFDDHFHMISVFLNL